MISWIKLENFSNNVYEGIWYVMVSKWFNQVVHNNDNNDKYDEDCNIINQKSLRLHIQYRQYRSIYQKTF